jgi:hypothetical protein
MPDSKSIKQIFEQQKSGLLDGLQKTDHPVAVLFGGQAACGKSSLISKANEMFPGMSFLNIDGDQYRIFHPEYKILTQDIYSFSKQTQEYSNIFTQCLIEAAITHSFSTTIEGTLRTLETPLRTATELRNNGFKVCIMAIAAPYELTELGALIRYAQEIRRKGFGRLVDFKSARLAYENIPSTLDTLYSRQAVDEIYIYSRFANTLETHYLLNNQRWNDEIMPSDIVKFSRNRQLQDEAEIAKIISLSEQLRNDIPLEVKSLFEEKILTVQRLIKS